MEWELILGRLIELVENTAPTLWGIMVKQVYVHAVLAAFSLLASACTVPILVKQTKASWAEEVKRHDDSVEYKRLVFTTGLGSVIVIILAATVKLIGYTINPEFYAIELLINYVK